MRFKARGTLPSAISPSHTKLELTPSEIKTTFTFVGLVPSSPRAALCKPDPNRGAPFGAPAPPTLLLLEAKGILASQDLRKEEEKSPIPRTLTKAAFTNFAGLARPHLLPSSSLNSRKIQTCPNNLAKASPLSLLPASRPQREGCLCCSSRWMDFRRRPPPLPSFWPLACFPSLTRKQPRARTIQQTPGPQSRRRPFSSR
ncbi:Hypothetical predicted protein [Podarcis lilfordi]|uniref:Uncharacterized protein n=1 Tax=Podarcis lilfordi TaxID=74358 RepID=A0AA35NW26_9SAUR|nr:Hypothetical predicted protein [Podarcis lilfordi]